MCNYWVAQFRFYQQQCNRLFDVSYSYWRSYMYFVNSLEMDTTSNNVGIECLEYLRRCYER